MTDNRIFEKCGDFYFEELDHILIECVCNKPLMLYVAPGKVVWMDCPKHGKFAVHGLPQTSLFALRDEMVDKGHL